MAKNEQPIFTKAPLIGHAAVTVANALRDGTGTIVQVVNGGVEGARIDLIEVTAIVTTTAGMIRLFLSEDSGVTWELWHEIPVTAITASATVPAFNAEFVPTQSLNLASTANVLGAATENAEEMNVFARGGLLEA